MRREEGRSPPALDFRTQFPESVRGRLHQQSLVVVVGNFWIFVPEKGGSLHRVAKGNKAVARKRVPEPVVRSGR